MVLHRPDPCKPFFLLADASSIGQGAVLSQESCKGNNVTCVFFSEICGEELHHWGLGITCNQVWLRRVVAFTGGRLASLPTTKTTCIYRHATDRDPKLQYNVDHDCLIAAAPFFLQEIPPGKTFVPQGGRKQVLIWGHSSKFSGHPRICSSAWFP